MAVPVPVNETNWGVPGALSAMLMEAERPRMACGVKVTVIEQVPSAATEVPHVLVCAKSPTFAPVIKILEIFRVALPVFVRVTL